MNPITTTLASLSKAYHELGYHTEVYQPKFINAEDFLHDKLHELKEQFSQKLRQEVERHEERKEQLMTVPENINIRKKNIEKFLQKVILFGLDEDLEKVKEILEDLKKHEKDKKKIKLIEKRIKLLEKKINKKFKGL